MKSNTVRVPAFITPNSLTIARLVLIPFGAVALFMNGGDDYNWQIISWWIFFILGLTDIVDGKLARSRQQITELGKFLDPARDMIINGGQCSVGIESTIIDCTQNTPTILRPGAITAVMINQLLDISIETVTNTSGNQIKASGLLESHYAPLAKVYLDGTPSSGDGFIALNNSD